MMKKKRLKKNSINNVNQFQTWKQQMANSATVLLKAWEVPKDQPCRGIASALVQSQAGWQILRLLEIILENYHLKFFLKNVILEICEGFLDFTTETSNGSRICQFWHQIPIEGSLQRPVSKAFSWIDHCF